MSKSYRPAAIETPDSVVPDATSHTPHREPQEHEEDAVYARTDWGGITAGVPAESGGGWWMRMISGGQGSTSVNAGSRAADGSSTSAGADVQWGDLRKSGLSVSRRRTTGANGVDTDGDVANGHDWTAKVSADGLQVAGRRARGENKLDGSVRIGPDGLGAKGGYESSTGRGGGVSFGVGDGREDLGVEIKPANDTSISGSVHRVEKDEAGRARSPVLDGRAWEVSHTEGWGVEGSVGFDAVEGGVAVSGGTSEHRRNAYQRSEDGIRAEFDPAWHPGVATWDDAVREGLAEDWLQHRYGSKLAARSIADVDLAHMAAGEGYTFQEDEGSKKGATGRLGPISLGFGDQDLEVSHTAVARDEKGWRVRVSTSETDADSKQGSVFGVGGSETHSETESGTVELTIADGPAGREALRRLQQTGLLPGADKLADPDDPDRVAYEEALAAYEYARILTAGTWEQLPLLRAELYEASGKLNARVLGAAGGSLVDASPEGVTYTDHTLARTEATSGTLGVLGLEIDSGTSKTWTDHRYRGARGAETERGYDLEQDWWWADDERTSVSVNPEGVGFRGKEAELVLRSMQSTDAGDRELLRDAGARGMDSAMVSAWALGLVDDGDQARVSLALSGDQLATIRDRLGPKGDDLAHIVEDAEYGIGSFGQDALAGSETGKLVLALGSEDGAGGRWAMGIGRDLAEDVVGKVRTVEDFHGLSFDEKRLFLVSAAQGAQYREEWKAGTGREDAQPWRVLPLALQVQDVEQRNQLVRDLFAAVEGSSLHSTCATLQLVQFLREDGARAGLKEAEIRKLLDGLSAEVADERVDERTQLLSESDDARFEVAAGLLADSARDLQLGDDRFRLEHEGPLGTLKPQRQEDVEAHRGDAMVDWLMAAERAKGPKLVAEALQSALLFDPRLVERLVQNTSHEPWRRTVALRILARAGVDVEAHVAKTRPAAG